jgi:hypothetical protein
MNFEGDTMLYLVTLAIGAIVSWIAYPYVATTLEYQLYKHLAQGRRVVICLDDTAYVYTLVDGKLSTQVLAATIVDPSTGYDV